MNFIYLFKLLYGVYNIIVCWGQPGRWPAVVAALGISDIFPGDVDMMPCGPGWWLFQLLSVLQYKL